MAINFARRVLVQACPELAQQVQYLGSVELQHAGPEEQEATTKVLLEMLQERNALTTEQLGTAYLNETGGPILCVSTDSDDSWLEIHAATGRVEFVYWPDVVDSEGGEP